jgi:Uma2 family endonuclease
MSKLDGKCVKGVPDMVVEILSPSTKRRDSIEKFQQYLKYGVREYWVVDPETRSLQVYILEDGKYVASVYGDTGEVKVSVLDDCTVSLPRVFPPVTSA